MGDTMTQKQKDLIAKLGYQPFDPNKKIDSKHLIKKVNVAKGPVKHIDSISKIFDWIPIKDGMTLSFHHHLRNGDDVLNMVLNEIKKRNLKNITLAPSAIFPVHEPMVELIKKKNITNIYTNYINGPVAQAISEGHLEGLMIMDTHGGRPRAIQTGELPIDVCFIAAPATDDKGNAIGTKGESACGSLGYAISDIEYAKHKVLVTDHIASFDGKPMIEGKFVDYICLVDKIGDKTGILSGTTKPTKDPIQLKIARQTIQLLHALDLVKDGLTFQTGAGGISLAVADGLKSFMLEKKIKGNFASGGITSFLVDMLELGLFEALYDVQCFDLEAVKSLDKNKKHVFMSASTYANINEENPIAHQLHTVILGATEVDLDFNVNVTTDSNGYLIGGSGGHSDTAFGADVTIITTNLTKSRLPIIKKRCDCITTPGNTVDLIVTERGIACHPNRVDLIEKLHQKNIPLKTIQELYNEALSITGVPEDIKKTDKVIGLIRYRDGSIIDILYQV